MGQNREKSKCWYVKDRTWSRSEIRM